MNLKPDILQFFAYEHLPAHLQAISKPFGLLAELLCSEELGLQVCAERHEALRKLLEAKDCAVRAKLYKEPLPEFRPSPPFVATPS